MPSTAAPSSVKRSRSSSMPRSSPPHISAIRSTATTRRCEARLRLPRSPSRSPRSHKKRWERPRDSSSAPQSFRGSPGLLEGPNQLSAYCEIAVAALGAWALVRRTLLLDVALGLAVFADVLTFSRAGWFALAVVAAVLALAGGKRAWTALKPGFAGLVAGAAGAAVWGIYARTPGVLRASLESSSYAGGVGNRDELWHAAWKMWLAHPILGVGAGNFELLLPAYGLFGIRTHANSWYLQALAEGGLLLLAATLLLIAAIVVPFARGGVRRLRDAVAVGPRGTRLHDRSGSASDGRLSDLLSEGRRRVVASDWDGCRSARRRADEPHRSSRSASRYRSQRWRRAAVARRALHARRGRERVLRSRDRPSATASADDTAPRRRRRTGACVARAGALLERRLCVRRVWRDGAHRIESVRPRLRDARLYRARRAGTVDHGVSRYASTVRRSSQFARALVTALVSLWIESDTRCVSRCLVDWLPALRSARVRRVCRRSQRALALGRRDRAQSGRDLVRCRGTQRRDRARDRAARVRTRAPAAREAPAPPSWPSRRSSRRPARAAAIALAVADRRARLGAARPASPSQPSFRCRSSPG